VHHARLLGDAALRIGAQTKRELEHAALGASQHQPFVLPQVSLPSGPANVELLSGAMSVSQRSLLHGTCLSLPSPDE
jgi:hypothetical protein